MMQKRNHDAKKKEIMMQERNHDVRSITPVVDTAWM